MKLTEEKRLAIIRKILLFQLNNTYIEHTHKRPFIFASVQTEKHTFTDRQRKKNKRNHIHFFIYMHTPTDTILHLFKKIDSDIDAY